MCTNQNKKFNGWLALIAGETQVKRELVNRKLARKRSLRLQHRETKAIENGEERIWDIEGRVRESNIGLVRILEDMRE